MCGVFGFVTSRGKGPDMGRLLRIALATQQRGDHAFGLAWIGKDGRMHAFKRPGAFTDRFSDLKICRDARAVIGHCRYATHGDAEDNRNNHPHPAGAGWFVHNGIVHNHVSLARRYGLKTKTECDSEVLGLFFSRLRGSLISRAVQTAAHAEGPLAMLGLWRAPIRLLLVKKGRPLHFGSASEGFYFGSLPDGLPEKPRNLKDHWACLFTFERKKLILQQRAIMPEQIRPGAW